MSFKPRAILLGLIAIFSANLLLSQVTMREVRDAYQEKEYAKADSLLEILCVKNPYEGAHWFWKGRTNFEAGYYEKAIKAYLHSDSLGYAKKWTAVGMAYAYKALDDQPNASKWFEKLVSLDPSWLNRLRGGSLSKFLEKEDYERLFGSHSDEDDEASGWRNDLEFLKNTLFRTHHQIDVRTRLSEWDSTYKVIYEQLPQLEKWQKALALARFVALAGDGHTNLWPQFNPDYQFTMIPIMIYPFADGHYVRAADETYAEMVGGKVLRIGNMDIDEVAQKLAVYVGHDNPMHDVLVRVPLICTVQMLADIGAINNMDKVPVTVALEAGEKVVNIKPIAWNYELLGHKLQASTWKQMYATDSAPLWLQKTGNIYWYEHLPAQDLLYLKIDQIANKEEQSLAAFVEEVFEKIEKDKINRLVLDLRMNDGGDSGLYRPLLLALIKSRVNKPGQFYTIIGRNTYSAAMNLTTDIAYWCNATLVGEPTGSSPVFIGENRVFHLPYSKLRISVSDRQHQRGEGSSVDKRIWIAPDIAAPLTAGHFAKGTDPAMEAILADIRQK